MVKFSALSLAFPPVVRMAVAVAVGMAAAWSPLAAQELTGQWLFQTEFGGASLEEKFVFEVDDGVTTGTHEGFTGKHVVTGTIEGDVAKFVVKLGSVLGELRYEGTIDGDTMEGTRKLVGSNFDVAGGDNSGTFVASRSSP